MVNNKFLLISFFLLFPIISNSAPIINYDYAEVIESTPITRIVHVAQPKQECWLETVTKNSPSTSIAPNIVGGVIGGVVGNQFGKGHGKDAATIAGAVIGGVIAEDAKKDSRNVTRIEHQQRCRTIDEGYDEERIDGYKVRYRYLGNEYQIRTKNDPGRQIKIRTETTVTPIISF